MKINSLLGIKIKDIAEKFGLHPNSVTIILRNQGEQKGFTPETIKKVEEEVLGWAINNGQNARKIAKDKGYVRLLD